MIKRMLKQFWADIKSTLDFFIVVIIWVVVAFGYLKLIDFIVSTMARHMEHSGLLVFLILLVCFSPLIFLAIWYYIYNLYNKCK